MSVQLGWSLISATIPCLKSFVTSLGSGYFGATLNANLGSDSSGGRSAAGLGSYVLSKLRPRVTGRPEPDPHDQRDGASVRSDGSQALIIRKQDRLRGWPGLPT
jgi:hypothetical protein